jgi:hypothetical protein
MFMGRMVTTIESKCFRTNEKACFAGFFYACVSLPGDGKSKQSLTLK